MSTTKPTGRRSETADAGRDRQRNRNERGVRSARVVTGRPGDKLPSPPRERRPAMAALAVLLIVGGAAVAGLLALRADSRVPVLVAASDISVGQEITRADLASVAVATDGLELIPADQVENVLGGYATQNIPAGRALEVRMLTSDGLLADGDVEVAVTVGPGRAPGLTPGDYVQVVRVLEGEGEVLVDRALVSAVSGAASGGDPFADGSTAAATEGLAQLVVSRADAPTVAAASAADQLSFVLVETGN